MLSSMAREVRDCPGSKGSLMFDILSTYQLGCHLKTCFSTAPMVTRESVHELVVEVRKVTIIIINRIAS
jgi:hypothetical protein